MEKDLCKAVIVKMPNIQQQKNRKICIFNSTPIPRSITNRIDIFAFDACMKMNGNHYPIPVPTGTHTHNTTKNNTKHQWTHFGWWTEPISYIYDFHHSVQMIPVCGTWIESTARQTLCRIHCVVAFCMRNCIMIAFCNLSWMLAQFADGTHKYTLITLPPVRLPYLFTHAVPLTTYSSPYHSPYGPSLTTIMLTIEEWNGIVVPN